jgi:hypothetical protein
MPPHALVSHDQLWRAEGERAGRERERYVGLGYHLLAHFTWQRRRFFDALPLLRLPVELFKKHSQRQVAC